MESQVLSPFVVYIVAQLNYISNFLTAITVISCFAMVGGAIIYLISLASISETDSKKESYKKFNCVMLRFVKYGAICGIISLFINCLTPNTKSAAAIYLIPKIVNNKQVQDIGSNSLQILEEYSKQFLNDLKNELKPEQKKSDKKDT